MTTPDGCPLCKADGCMLEHLAHDWLLCNCCGRKFRRDDHRVTWTDTNHTPTPPKPPVERDVSGVIVRDP